MQVWCLNRQPVDLPAGFRLRVAAGPADLHAARPGDLILWVDPPFAPSLTRLAATGCRVLSPEGSVVVEARRAGVEALLLPDLEPGRVARALRGAVLPLRAGSLDPEGAELWVEGRALALSPREASLVAALARARGAVVSRETLCAALGMSAATPSRAVDTAISRLRGRMPGGSAWIGSVRGDGWRLLLVAPPTESSGRAPPSADPIEGLTGRESAIYKMLQAAGGGRVSAAALHLRVWRGEGDRGAVYSAMSRLRHKLPPGAIARGPGPSYRLAMEAKPWRPDPPAPRTVGLIGCPGVGKTHRARALAATHGARWIELADRSPRSLEELLRGVRGPVVVDGLDDARPYAQALAAARGPLWYTARAAAGIPGEHIEVLAPCSEEAMARLLPDASPAQRAAADGLPLALLDPAAMRARVEALSSPILAALTRLSAFPTRLGPDDEALLGPGLPGLEELRRQGLVLGDRLLAPIAAILAPRLDPEGLGRAALVRMERLRSALRARPFRRDELASAAQDMPRVMATLSEPACRVEAALLRGEAQVLLGAGEAGWIFEVLPLATPTDRTHLMSLFARLARADLPATLQTLDALAAEATTLRDRLWVDLLRVPQLGRAGRVEEGRAVLERVLASLDGDPTPGLELHRARALRFQAVFERDAASKLPLVREALVLLERARWEPQGELRAGTPSVESERCQLLGMLALVLRRMGRVDDARVAYREAALASAELPRESLWVRLNHATLEVDRGDWRDALPRLLALEEEGAQAGLPELRVLALTVRAEGELLRGDLAAVGPLLAHAEQLAREMGMLDGVGRVEWVRALGATLAGDPASARAHTLASRQEEPEASEALALLAEAILAARRGEPERARALLSALSAPVQGLAASNDNLRTMFGHLVVRAGLHPGPADRVFERR